MKRHAFALALTLAIVGCTTNPPPIVSTSGVHVRLMRGLGGAWLSPGVDQIAAMVAKVPGVTLVQVYEYTQANQIAAEIGAEPSAVKQVIGGYSCGANASPVAAASASPRAIHMVAVIQASLYCGGTPLTPNVLQAQETYNPDCAETAGLGCKKLDVGPGFPPSHLTIIVRPDCHPCADTNPDAQADIVDAVKRVTLAKALYKRIPGEPNIPRVVVRYHGEHL